MASEGEQANLSGVQSVIAALRARQIDRVAIGYAVAGWVVVQAASIALPSFDAPAWVMRAVILFILIGFPLALAFAWFAVPFGYHPEAAQKPQARTHALFGTVAAVVIAVAANLAYLLSRLPVPQLASHAAPVAAAQTVAKNSIAVLPFLNMSGDPAKEYFSDGISEELLNDLANTPALLVAARTSSFAFKGKPANIKDIARVLGVRSVLEGSVRESGTHLRITGQLIDAASGYHLWSATYDRDLTDVLVVQEDIAHAITAALTSKLLPQKPQNSAHPIDPAAYQAYLLGKHQLGPRTDGGMEAAIVSFTKTTTLAPNFSDGFAALARAQINLAEDRPERIDLIPAAESELARALVLDPRNVNALSTRLDLSLHKLDWNAAIADANLMQAISPNSAQVLHELFRYYLFTGFPASAFAAASGAVKLNPLSFVDRLNLASFLFHDAQYAKAIPAADAALALEHDQSSVLSLLCSASANSADLTRAHDAEGRLAKTAGDASNDTQFCRFTIAIAEHRTTDALGIVDSLAATYLHGGPSAFELGEKYAIAGNNTKALEWFDRSYKANEFFLVLLGGDKLIPPAFFQTDGWKALNTRPLFTTWRQAHTTIAASMAAN